MRVNALAVEDLIVKLDICGVRLTVCSVRLPSGSSRTEKLPG